VQTPRSPRRQRHASPAFLTLPGVAASQGLLYFSPVTREHDCQLPYRLNNRKTLPMSQTQFTVRRKVLSLLGAKFHIFNEEGKLIGFSRQKAFKLKEDIRVYTDESMSRELLSIMARQVIDFGAAYDVVDSSSAEKVGALRRQGLRSLLRDQWLVLDEEDRQIGIIEEDNQLFALIRRFVTNLVPQSYHLLDGDGRQLARMHRHFNPFVQKLTVTVEDDDTIDPHLVLAAGILLVAIEGRQG
jgi:hypothetical protein